MLSTSIIIVPLWTLCTAILVGSLNQTSVMNSTDEVLEASLSSNGSSAVDCTHDNCTSGTWIKDNKVKEAMIRSLWCPPGYYLHKEIRQCMQMSCLWKTPSMDIQQVNASVDVFADKGLVCVEPSAHYKNCWKIHITPNQYIVSKNNASIWILKTETTIQLGEFVILKNGTVSICSDMVSASEDPWIPTSSPWYTEDFLNAMSQACMPFNVSSDDFHLVSSGTALVLNGTKSLKPYFYDTDNFSNGSVNVCYELTKTYLACQPKGLMPSGHFEFLSNLDIKVPLRLKGEVIYSLGDYVLPFDGSGFGFCPLLPKNEEETLERKILYGIVLIVSAIFLLVTLFAHSLFPSLNYHTKALLCHIISLFFMYVSFSTHYFAELYYWTTIECYLLFIIAYVSSVGAFCWLNVIAFDLWRVFSEMRVSTQPGSDQKKKKKFILQCVYSWGIPIVLCFIAIIIDNDIELQRALDLDLQLSRSSWFQYRKPMFAFYYGPVLIILTVNSIFFALTIRNFRKASKGTDILNNSVSQQLFKVTIKLFLVMGLCWFTDIVSWFSCNSNRWHYITDSINGLQGVAIFFIYVFKKSTLTLIKKRLGYSDKEQPQATVTTAPTKNNKKNNRDNMLQTVSNSEMDSYTHGVHEIEDSAI